ncbi:MAG: response regulator [Candidatus Sericytochromatia bacterium]
MTRPLHVLVADDVPDNRGLLSQLLRHEGYRVSEAADGVEALALLAKGDVDLLLLDLQMPRMDGFEVLTRLGSMADQNLPVLVVTAAAEREARLRALELGAQDFVTKPVDSQELRARIRTLESLKVAHDRVVEQARALQAANDALVARQDELERLNAALRNDNGRIELEVARRTEALRAAMERLEAADRYKDEFLSVISHELRTPLNFIMGFASVIADELAGPITERQADYMDKILKGADRMLLLVNDLLDFARIRSGDFHLMPAETELGGVIDEVLATMAPLAEQKGVRLGAQVELAGPMWVDGQRLAQVLTNLVDNGVKFTPTGGQVRIEASSTPDGLLMWVRDTGCGIAEADQPRLFHRFQQLDMGKTRRAGGVGLGLAICKAIVEAHGGNISLQSELGVGTAFHVSMPLARPISAPRQASSAPDAIGA